MRGAHRTQEEKWAPRPLGHLAFPRVLPGYGNVLCMWTTTGITSSYWAVSGPIGLRDLGNVCAFACHAGGRTPTPDPYSKLSSRRSPDWLRQSGGVQGMFSAIGRCRPVFPGLCSVTWVVTLNQRWSPALYPRTWPQSHPLWGCSARRGRIAPSSSMPCD